MKRYNIIWVNGGYRIGEENPLTEEEVEFRTNNSYYHKNGKPKKSEMACMNQEYNYGHYCAGNQCYYYAHGCDQCGREWQ
jgi:hypothetical protein